MSQFLVKSAVSYKLRGENSICCFGWDVAMQVWKVGYGKVEITSFVVRLESVGSVSKTNFKVKVGSMLVAGACVLYGHSVRVYLS